MSERLVNPLEKRQRITAKVLIAAVIILSVAFLGSIAYVIHGGIERLSGKPYQIEIEHARGAGIPVTAIQLQPPVPSPELNAAPFYTRIDADLKAHPLAPQEKIADSLLVLQIPSYEQFDRIRKALKIHSKLVSLIHRAASRPYCVFVKDYSDPSFPEMATMLEAARLLTSESILMAHEGKPLDAVRNESLGFTFAQHAATDNTGLLGYIYAVDIDSITERGLQDILYISGGNRAVSDAVRTSIETKWRAHSLAKALRVEAGTKVVMFQRLRTKGPLYFDRAFGIVNPLPANMDPRTWHLMIDETGKTLLQRDLRVISAADLSYAKSTPVFQSVGNETQHDQDTTHLLPELFGDVYLRLSGRQARNEAMTQVTRSAAAVLAWKDQHGAYPASLAEVLNPAPIDPFDLKPLRYRLEGAGFVVYSGGKDSTYDGGAPNMKRPNDSILFRYPFPSYYAGLLNEK